MIADIYHEYNIFTDAKSRVDIRLAVDVVPARNQKARVFFRKIGGHRSLK